MKAPPSNVTSLRSTLVLEGEITSRSSLGQDLATIFLPSSRNQKLKMKMPPVVTIDLTLTQEDFGSATSVG